jgi:iron uptake system component EfeO
MEFTSFHRLENLWVSGVQADTASIAERLRADVAEVVRLAKGVELKPLELANGAKSLLDEVATGKITGEEDRYSHTDLWDFRGNVNGSKAAIAALQPAIQEKDVAKLSTLDEKFATLDKLLESHRKDDRFKLYTELSKDEIKALAGALDGLGEPVSKVAELVTS